MISNVEITWKLHDNNMTVVRDTYEYIHKTVNYISLKPSIIGTKRVLF